MMKKFYSILTTFVAITVMLLSFQETIGQGYYNQLAQQCNPTTGGTETMSFTGTFPNANGNGTLTIIYRGDLNSGAEILTFNGETGPSLGITAFVTQCTGIDSVTYTIPMATINAWAATGAKIDVTAVADASVNSGLTACIASSSFCVTGRLSYPFATGPNDAGASAITPTIICPGSDSVRVSIHNYGTNQIDSVWVNWRKNGTLQTPIHLKTLLDTAAGTGSSSAIVNLGLHTFTAGNTENFEVWTTLPNGVVDTTVNNDTTRAAIKPSLTGTYTIGGTLPDYTTFALAIADLKAIGICGPIVFNVRQGTYNEKVSIGNVSGSSSINTITFQSDPSNTAMPLIQSAGTSADNYVLRLESGAHHITFDSLNFKTTGTTYSIVVSIPGASDHITINDCVLDGYVNGTTSTFASVFYQTGGLSHYNTITNNTLNDGSYSIYLRGPSTAVTGRGIGNVVRNNSLNNPYYYQAYLYAQDSMTFDQNVIVQDPSSTTFTYGVYAYYCNNSKVTRNKVTLNTSSTNYGLRIGRWAGTDNEVSNNMVITSATCAGTAYGMFIDYNLNTKIYHNTVNVRSGNGPSTRALYVSGSASTLYGNEDIRNNIFVNSVPGGYASYILSGATTGYISNLDNNIYHAQGTSQFYYGTTTHATFAAYQTASTKDSNSFFGVPGFFSQTDLHLQGGIAADAGANLGIMIDIDGDVRPLAPSTGYDIGCDEYIPPTCPMGYGLTSFGLTSTSADVTWTVGSNDTTWIFEYGAPGFTPGTGTSLFSANDTATISGLLPVTDYCVYVRGICSAGDTSLYFGPHCFKTRCVSSLSGLYTINSTLPTAGTNYASFGDAMNALNNCGVSGPTTFHVKQGTYTEQIDIGNIVGASTTNTVTFKGDPTNTSAAILTFNATTTANNYVVRYSGAEHIIIDDLTITAANPTYAYVIHFPTTANNITIKNSVLNGSPSATTSTFGAVIYNQSGAASIINNVTIDSNDINNGSYAMYMWGGSTTVKEKGLKVTNNNIIGFNYYGPYFYYQDSITVDNNIITQKPTATSFTYGIYSYYLDNAKVRGNTITLNSPTTNYGIMIGRYAGLDNEVSNNMIITSARCQPTNTAYGIYINYALNTRVYHNSVNVREGSPTFSRALYVTGSTSTLYGNVDIRNNIFSNIAGGYASYVLAGAATTFLSGLDYNIYFSTGANVINYSNINYTSIAAYQLATTRDSNSYFSTPQYVSASDLHVAGVVAYDNGDPSLGIMTDIDGDVRPLAPSTGWDIGADEFIPPTCPSPYSMTLDTVSTTSATLSWTNGPADVNWILQYGAPGFTLGTGTTVNSTTNPYVMGGLTHSTCYDVWIRSFCSVGDTSLWSGPFNFCTKCAPVSDYCTNFDSDAINQTPFCWKTYINTTATAAYVQTVGFTSFSAPNCVRMYNQNDASAVMMLIAPEVTTASAGTHRMSLNVRADTTVIVGTMSNPTNPGTFIPWDTLTGLSNSGYTNFRIPFTTAPAGHTAAHVYPAILWVPGATYDNVYIDDYCWEKIPSCEKAPAVTVLNPGIDSTSLNIGWNYDTTSGASAQVSYIINYGPAGYDPVSNPAGGATTTSTFNFVNISGLQPLTEYCVWVKAVCANGDTSTWSGPHCGSTGCPDGIRPPYFDDFTDYLFVSGVGEQLPQCWSEAKGQLGSSSNIAPGNSIWTYDGFANVGFNGSAKMNVNYTSRWEWLVSPTFYLGTDVNVSHWVEFDAALTQAFSTLPAANGFGYDDTVALVVSYDKGITWKKSDILMQWDSSSAPSNTGTHIAYALKATTGYVTFGFYATSTVTNENVEFFVDNFSIRDTVFLGVEETEFTENFRVYPNPNNGVFTIVNDGKAQRSSVKLLDIQGRVVFDSQYNFAENGSKEIEVSNLTSGVYVLLIQSEGKTEQHRIVVQ